MEVSAPLWRRYGMPLVVIGLFMCLNLGIAMLPDRSWSWWVFAMGMLVSAGILPFMMFISFADDGNRVRVTTGIHRATFSRSEIHGIRYHGPHLQIEFRQSGRWGIATVPLEFYSKRDQEAIRKHVDDWPRAPPDAPLSFTLPRW